MMEEVPFILQLSVVAWRWTLHTFFVLDFLHWTLSLSVAAPSNPSLNDGQVCKSLLDKNAFVNSKTKLGWTALHFAASKVDLMSSVASEKIRTKDLLLQGDQVQLLFSIHFWRALKTQKLPNPNHFCQAYIITFWYFDVSIGSGEKSWTFQGFAKIVLWLRTARTDNPDTLKTH